MGDDIYKRPVHLVEEHEPGKEPATFWIDAGIVRTWFPAHVPTEHSSGVSYRHKDGTVLNVIRTEMWDAIDVPYHSEDTAAKLKLWDDTRSRAMTEAGKDHLNIEGQNLVSSMEFRPTHVTILSFRSPAIAKRAAARYLEHA